MMSWGSLCVHWCGSRIVMDYIRLLGTSEVATWQYIFFIQLICFGVCVCVCGTLGLMAMVGINHLASLKSCNSSRVATVLSNALFVTL